MINKFYMRNNIFIFITSFNFSAQVSITTDGSSADASTMIDVKSTDKGILIPRMTTAQVDDFDWRGTTHWQSSNTEATNSSGFSALAGGGSNGNGFTTIGRNTKFRISEYPNIRHLKYNNSKIIHSNK